MANASKKHPSQTEHELPAWARRAAWMIFFGALLSMALMHQPKMSWNSTTRLALVFAVVDDKNLSIDNYHDLGRMSTGDKAIFEGRYYSDKVFGVSVLAMPLYATMQLVGGITGYSWELDTKLYLLRVWAVSVPASAALAILWLLMIRVGAQPKRALLAVAFAFWGSLWYGYSTIFMPYSLGIAAALGAFYLTIFPPGRRFTPKICFAIGFLNGIAMIADFIFGLIVVAIGVVYLMRLVDQTGLMGLRCFADMKGPRTRFRDAGGLVLVGALGGAIPLAFFYSYCYAIFGEFAIPYRYEASELFREGMAQGFMGVTQPRPAWMYFLTIHPYRGVLFWYPWILAALVGCAMMVTTTGKRRVFGWLGIWAFVAYLLFNSGYYMWWGGWAMGPRLMLPMFVFVPLGLVEFCRRDTKPIWFWTMVTLGTVAVLLNFPLSFMNPDLPQGVPHPILSEATFNSLGLLTSPGLDFLKWFYTFSFLGVDPPPSGAFYFSFLACVAAPIGIGVWIWKQLPEKHLSFERPEVPAVNFDGAAAPAPTPLRR